MLLLACADADPCADYAEMPGAHTVCLRALARKLTDRGEMEALCEGDVDCRRAWVQTRLKAGATDAELLLGACRDDDCLLAVLDSLPDPDPLVQASRCSRAARYAADCRGHTAQRWRMKHPSLEEIARVTAGWPEGDPGLGSNLGWLYACEHGPACPEGGGMTARECNRVATLPNVCAAKGFVR